MGGGAVVAAGGVLGHAVQLAGGRDGGLCAGALAVSGARAAEHCRASAADHAARGDRLPAFADLWHTGAGRRFSGPHAGLYLCVQMDRCGAGRRGHGVPLHGAGGAIVHRSRRSETGAGRVDAGGVTGLDLSHGHPAPDPAGHHRGHGADLCQGHGRIRGATITFVSNIPGQTQTIPLAIDLALETPGGEALAARLAVLSIVLAATALALSEWISRRVAARVGGT